MKPKVWHACVICDHPCRDVHAHDPRGRPRRVGHQHVGTRVLTLLHLDGSISDHSLCGHCPVQPQHVPRIWERQALEYVNIASERTDPAHLERFTMNIPIGVLHIREITQEGQR